MVMGLVGFPSLPAPGIYNPLWVKALATQSSERLDITNQDGVRLGTAESGENQGTSAGMPWGVGRSHTYEQTRGDIMVRLHSFIEVGSRPRDSLPSRRPL
jgi:hypothetical protein